MIYKNIFEAMTFNDINAVKSFLPAHVNDINKYGDSALVFSILYEKRDCFDLLLENNADLNFHLSDNGEKRHKHGSLLYLLILYKWLDKIQIAVEHGLDVNSMIDVSRSKIPAITFLCRNYFHNEDG